MKVLAGEALETEDEIRLNYHYAADWALLYSEWVQRELGLVGEFATSGDLVLKFLQSSRGAMEFWRGLGERTFPARFVEYVNKAAPAREAETGTSFVENLVKAVTTREEGSAGTSPPSSSDT